jgi:hypothetical protein
MGQTESRTTVGAPGGATETKEIKVEDSMKQSVSDNIKSLSSKIATTSLLLRWIRSTTSIERLAVPHLIYTILSFSFIFV